MPNKSEMTSVPVWRAFRVADVLLWLIAIGGLLALFITLWRPAGAAAEVAIMVDNEIQQTLSLSENQQLSVNGSLGESLITVKDGQVRFLSSPCRNQVCVHSGWASHSGELLACLPNRIALVLQGEAARNPEVDGVNF